jgi:hypothetical protein
VAPASHLIQTFPANRNCNVQVRFLDEVRSSRGKAIAMSGPVRLVLLALCAIVFSGCASLPEIVERHSSSAIDPATPTPLGKIASDSSPNPDMSGFRLMPVGSFALDTRVQLAQRAVKTLDVQCSSQTTQWRLLEVETSHCNAFASLRISTKFGR